MSSETKWALAQIGAGFALAAIAPWVTVVLAEAMILVVAVIFLILASKVGDSRPRFLIRRRAVVLVAMGFLAVVPIYGEASRTRAEEESRKRSAEILEKAVEKGLAAALQKGFPQPPAPLIAVPERTFEPPIAATGADFIPNHFRTDFVYRREGEYLAVVFLTLQNPTALPVESLRIQHQHRPGAWTDPVGPGPQMRLEPRTVTLIHGSADTFADPQGALSRGDKLYFAYRADWDNPSGAPGCKTFFVEFSSKDGEHPLGRVVDSIPRDVASEPRFAIKPCPKKG